MKKIKVLAVDDSALIRSLLGRIVNDAPDMELVGAAPDPIIAREMIRNLNPDVLTLDVEMPRMDGLDFLERLMRLRPMPVLMISTLTEKGADVTLRALEIGAVDFITKPKIGIQSGMEEYAATIVEKIRMASAVKFAKPAALGRRPGNALPFAAKRLVSREKVIIVGASTGGTIAIQQFLKNLPPDCPGILIAQHMPEFFTNSFAARLDGICRITVREAKSGERILPGHAFVAPGHSHLLLRRSGAYYVTELSQSPPVNKHRPSVDVLFRSAAEAAGKNAIGVILTGMGKDGAVGMREMKEAGAYNFAQDEETCVVFGMPREAIAQGGVDEIVPIHNMDQRVLARLGAMASMQPGKS